MVSLPNWLSNNQFFAAILNPKDTSNNNFANTSRRQIANPDEPIDFAKNEEVVIGSRWYSGVHEVHKLFLDIDVEHVYKASRTPGHGHLLLNVNLTRKELETLTEILVELGITGRGNLTQIQEAEQLFLRW